MGIISVDLFLTLDGVYQGPGAPDEDRSGGFTLGGWQAASSDAEAGAAITAGIERMDALLLGRKTYDIFAGYWPALRDSTPIAAKFNALPKFVVSRTMTNPEWEGTTALSNMALVAALKGQFHDMHVVGSGNLVRSLLEADLADRLNFFLYPLILGSGKRLFADGTGVPAAFSLVHPPTAFPKGAVALVYERAGVPVTGFDMGEMT
ncbi:riboflavin biosynthesis protein RibD domain-containing protein [Arthrobacter sp. PAMC 25486]|uniref:dihydrofolate reductase family protein n=1 Tax=Arthrobacter sp. PAMC 25486 TaxID=1494608 RepID=UPI000535A53B|nr:dihydrofolate reductase family protein [Arthrobacter sp. PAMC 25486]AIY00175.1 riboflavin biosynthesis protein RibD domain-containing protein [Arthrobacter sp. PAMC 25486]